MDAATPEDAGPRPLRRDAERNRRRILDAAARVFAERGLGATLDEIAQAADVGVGTVYRRFADKDELIDALFDAQIDDVVAIAEEALARADAWDGLEHFLRAVVERQAGNRGLKELLLGARTGADDGCAPRGRERIEPLVERIVGRAHEQGQLRADFSTTDVPLLQQMVGSVVDYTRDIDADVWRRLLTIVLDGLRASRTTTTPMQTPPLDRDGVLRAMSGWRPRARA